MSQIIAIHSYRRGTGKSSLAVNLAVLFAAAGKRIGLIDASLQYPSLHLPFRLQASKMGCFLNDYLDNNCTIEQTVQDVTGRLDVDLKGKVFLIPADTKLDEFNFARKQFPAERMENGILNISEILALDHLFIDTPAGINDNALLSMAICDTLLEVLRLDQQDYQGTAVILELARKLAIPQIFLVANFVTKTYRPKTIRVQLQQSYGFDVAAILPNSENMVNSSLRDIFVLTFPQHPFTVSLRHLVTQLGDYTPQ